MTAYIDFTVITNQVAIAIAMALPMPSINELSDMPAEARLPGTEELDVWVTICESCQTAQPCRDWDSVCGWSLDHVQIDHWPSGSFTDHPDYDWPTARLALRVI